MFTRLGIDKGDVELIVSALLSINNIYWMLKFNNIKYNDQMFKSVKDQNDVQQQQIEYLQHQVAAHRALRRRATNKQPVA